VVGAVTCMPDVLDPDIGAGGEEEPVDRYEEEADHVAGQGDAHEEYWKSLQGKIRGLKTEQRSCK